MALPRDFPKVARAAGVSVGGDDAGGDYSAHTLASMCGRIGKKISQYANVRDDRRATYRAELESNVRDVRRACDRIRAEIERRCADRPEDERRDLAADVCRRMVRGVASARLREIAESTQNACDARRVVDGLLADRDRPPPKPKPKPAKTKPAKAKSVDFVPTEDAVDAPSPAVTEAADDELRTGGNAADATPTTGGGGEGEGEGEADGDDDRERAYRAAEEFVRAMDAASLCTDRSIDEATRACGEAYRAIVDVLGGRQIARCIRAPAALVPALVADRLYATAAAVLRGHCMSLVAMTDEGAAFDDAYERTAIRPLQFYAALTGRQLPGDASAPTETGVRFDDDPDAYSDGDDGTVTAENRADAAEAEAPDLWLARAGYVAVPLASATDDELDALKFQVREPPFPETEPASVGFTVADVAKGCRGLDRECFGWLYRDAESGEPAGAVLVRRARFSVPMPNDEAGADLPYAVPPWNDAAGVETLEILKMPVVYAGDAWLERCMVTHATQAAQAAAADADSDSGSGSAADEREVQAWCARLPVTRLPAQSTYVVDTRRAAFWHKHFKMSRCFPFARFDDPALASGYFSRRRPPVYGEYEDEEAPTMLRPMPSDRQLASFARAAIADRPADPAGEPEPEPNVDDGNGGNSAPVQPSAPRVEEIPEPEPPGSADDSAGGGGDGDSGDGDGEDFDGSDEPEPAPGATESP